MKRNSGDLSIRRSLIAFSVFSCCRSIAALLPPVEPKKTGGVTRLNFVPSCSPKFASSVRCSGDLDSCQALFYRRKHQNIFQCNTVDLGRRRWLRVGRLRGGAKSDDPVVSFSTEPTGGQDSHVASPSSMSATKKGVIGALLSPSEHDRDIWSLALPALFSLLVDPILSLVDTAYVGRGLGAISLASLGPCTSIFHFSFNTFRSLTQSTTALISASLAAGEDKKAGQIVQQMYLLACLLGLGLMAGLLTQAPRVLALMGAGEKTVLFPQALAYLKGFYPEGAVCFLLLGPNTLSPSLAKTLTGACSRTRGGGYGLAVFVFLMIMVSEGVFRGHADTRTPAVAASSAACANIVLDPLLMFAMGFGMSGAAGATVLSQYFAVGIYGILLWRGAVAGKMAVPFFGRKPGEGRTGGGPSKGDSKVVKALPLLMTVVSANAAMLLRTTSLMACWAVATAVAARISAASVGSHQVALSLWLLFALVAEAPSIAAQVLGARLLGDVAVVSSVFLYIIEVAVVFKYLGQGDLERARSMARRAATWTLACSGALALVLLAFSGVIPRCFTSDPAVLQRLRVLLPLLALQQPLVSLVLVMEGLLVGAGQFRWLGSTTVVTSAISAALVMLIGRYTPGWDVVGIWGGITVMFLGRLLASGWRLLDRKSGPYWVPRRSSSVRLRG